LPKLLIIEDDAELRVMCVSWLSAEHYTIDEAENGADGLERLRMGAYDVVVLDWEMPEMDGLQVLNAFRREGGATPVLFLTGRNSEAEIETGLDAGADDYLTKPFGMKELSARIRALLRRSTVNPSSTLRIGDLVLDPAQHRVTSNNQEVQLTPKEFAVLEFFMRHPNAVFSAEALIQRIWPDETSTTADTFRSYVTRLRQKLGGDEAQAVIENVPRIGYRLRVRT
jgi:DNA-binding response OmpR family regulator